MKLRHLRVEQWRQFRQAFEIRDLKDGINLFTGPNESGKSTLVRAIRAAFFERCRSSSVEDLRPWGDSAASPTVSLEFEWGGETWTLVKSFLGTKRCELRVAGHSLSSSEAEDRLADLLGYEFAGRGPSQEQHWGIPGVLWVEQGSGQNIREPITLASEHLGRALGEILGDVRNHSGDDLIAGVDRQRGLLLTATGRPTGEYARVQKEAADLENECAQLRARIEAYRHQVDHLGQLRGQCQEDQARRVWETHRLRAQEAREALKQVEAWQRDQEIDRRALQDCSDGIRARRELLGNLAERQQDLERRRRMLDEARQGLEEHQQRQTQVAASLEMAGAAREQARADSRLALAHQRRLELEREQAQIEADIADLGNALERARTLQGQVLDRRRSLQSLELDSAGLERLGEVDAALAHLKIRQEAVATRVQFDLLEGQTVWLGAEALHGAGERLLLEPAALEIAGIGSLRILPGGQDTAELARQRQVLEDEHSGLLGRLGVSSLGEARTRQEKARELRTDLARDEQMLASLAPQGVDELAARLELRRSRRQGLLDALADLPASATDALSVPGAESRLQEAELRLQQAQGAHRAFLETLGLRRQALDSARMEWERLQAEHQDPERLRQHQQASEQLLELRARQGALEASIGQRQARIDEARPDILSQDVDRFERSAEAAERQAAGRREELARLEASLQTLGAEGLEEEHAAKCLDYERLVRRRDQLGRRAAALDLLRERLRKHRQDLARSLQEPLQRHLDHYVGLLLPQASLSLDEILVPKGLIRPGEGGEEHGQLDGLSFGAREQMGLISRLAYADLLREAGHPTLIILDDALVHSDEARLAQMKRILHDAARRHQILLFSCHPHRWDDLGVAAREIVSLKLAQGR